MIGAWIVPAGHTRIAIEGALDFDTVVPLLAQSRRYLTGGERLEIDLHGVRRANSAGLALMLEWLELARRYGVSLQFQSPPESLMRLAAVTNVAELLPVVTRGG